MFLFVKMQRKFALQKFKDIERSIGVILHARKMTNNRTLRRDHDHDKS